MGQEMVGKESGHVLALGVGECRHGGVVAEVVEGSHLEDMDMEMVPGSLIDSYRMDSV